MSKTKFYSLRKILQKDAYYNVIFGERSNGKTFAVQEYGLKQYHDTGKQMAVVRRYQEDYTGKRGSTTFDGIVKSGRVAEIFAGEWTDIYYYASRWYLCRWEDGRRVQDEKPFAFGFALSSMEHDKSTNYPDITTVLFDEFLSRMAYLPDEFTLLMNVLSTIIRHRRDVKIFMLGNTVNKYCPYFSEMGLKHVKEMKPGDIDVYRYGDSDLIVAVEYTKPNNEGKESDLYFAFDNPSLKMITSGSWEIDIYPHCPEKFKPKDILFTYFIRFDDTLLQCEIVQTENNTFTFIHPKTTEMKNPENEFIYSRDFSPNPKHFRNITRPRTSIEKKIAEFYARDKVFYSDNETGEVVRNYLIWCGKDV